MVAATRDRRARDRTRPCSDSHGASLGHVVASRPAANVVVAVVFVSVSAATPCGRVLACLVGSADGRRHGRRVHLFQSLAVAAAHVHHTRGRCAAAEPQVVPVGAAAAPAGAGLQRSPRRGPDDHGVPHGSVPRVADGADAGPHHRGAHAVPRGRVRGDGAGRGVAARRRQ